MSQSVKVGQLMYVPGSIVVLKLELLHKSKPDFLNAICKMERGESIAIVMFTLKEPKKYLSYHRKKWFLCISLFLNYQTIITCLYIFPYTRYLFIFLRKHCFACYMWIKTNPAQTDGCCASANISAVLYHTRPWLMMSLSSLA